MTTLLSQPVFALYALCSAILVVILYGIGFFCREDSQRPEGGGQRRGRQGQQRRPGRRRRARRRAAHQARAPERDRVYVTAKQPLRTLAFVVGAVVNLVMVVQVLRAVL